MWICLHIWRYVCVCVFILFSPFFSFFFLFFVFVFWLYHLWPNIGSSEEMKTGHCLNGFLHTHTYNRAHKHKHTHICKLCTWKFYDKWLADSMVMCMDRRHTKRPANEHPDWLTLLTASGQTNAYETCCFFVFVFGAVILSDGRTFTTTIVFFYFFLLFFFFWILLLSLFLLTMRNVIA